MKLWHICRQTPQIKHWIPTKARELFSPITWQWLESLPNVKVRYSSPDLDDNVDKKYGSMVISKYYQGLSNTASYFQCPSSLQGNKCLSCRACWSKHIEVIAYLKH